MHAAAPRIEVPSKAPDPPRRLLPDGVTPGGQAEILMMLHKTERASDRTSCYSPPADRVRRASFPGLRGGADPQPPVVFRMVKITARMD